MLNIPYVQDALIILGSLVVICSVLAPIIVRLTFWTDTDNKWLKRVFKSRAYKILAQLKRFSIF